MFVRRSFNEFLKLHSEGAPEAKPDTALDWRCLYPEDNQPSFPSERSLIGCGTWAKPKRPKPA
jgi:hypothetical protein